MYDFSKAELLSNNRNDGGAQSSRRFIVALIGAFLLNLAAAGWAVAQDEVVYHQAGSVMNYDSITGVNGVKAYLIFWQPPNYNFTAAGGPADDVYINTISTFFADLSAQDISLADLSARGFNVKDGYFQITQQYTGPCNGDPILLPEGACSPGPLIYDPLNDQFVDPAPFPPSFPGTPLQESDIQNRIIANINAHNWTAGPTAVFFVFLPYGVEECQQPVMGKVSCSGDGFCAYHNSFSFGQNGNVIYAVMPQVRSIGEGCSIDRSTLPENGYAPVEFSNHYAAPSATPNQLDADWEIFALSHELFESMTDPLLNAWYQPPPPNCTGDNCSDEIGDICNSMAGGFSPGHGGNLLLTSINSRANVVFDEFLVPEVWSNGAQSCVLGSSVRLTIHTGPVRGATSPLSCPPLPDAGE